MLDADSGSDWVSDVDAAPDDSVDSEEDDSDDSEDVDSDEGVSAHATHTRTR